MWQMLGTHCLVTGQCSTSAFLPAAHPSRVWAGSAATSERRCWGAGAHWTLCCPGAALLHGPGLHGWPAPPTTCSYPCTAPARPPWWCVKGMRKRCRCVLAGHGSCNAGRAHGTCQGAPCGMTRPHGSAELGVSRHSRAAPGCSNKHGRRNARQGARRRPTPAQGAARAARACSCPSTT